MERTLFLAAALAALPFGCGDDVAWDDGAIMVTPEGLTVEDFDWGRDGVIVAAYGNYLYVVDSESGRFREITGREGFLITGGVCWSPDGDYIALGASKAEDFQNIYVLSRDAKSVDEARKLTYAGGAVPAWAPNGKLIAYSSTEGISLIPAEGGEAKLEVGGGGYPAWSPNGEYIAYVKEVGEKAGTTDVFLKPLGHPRETRLTNMGLWVSHPDWSPYGRFIALTVKNVKERGRKNDIWAVPAKGGTPIKVTDEPGTNYRGTVGADGPRWTPDGNWVAFYSPRGEHIGQGVSPAIWKVHFK